jgi:DNA-binding NtrC family response regulator
LLRLHRNSLSHVLIVGGHREERAAVALAFHRMSALRLGSFVRVDCSLEEGRLRAALHHWLTRAGHLVSANSLWSAERGTLYLESIASLSLDSQQLLLTFAHRCSAPIPGEGGWTGRLAVGSDEDPWDLVSGGRFLGNLADGLDKIRVELDSRRQGGAA